MNDSSRTRLKIAPTGKLQHVDPYPHALTYGKNFTHYFRDIYLCRGYPDTLPNFASNFRLRLFRRAVYHRCRRRVSDSQEDF